MFELTVTVKGAIANGDGSTYKEKFNVYEDCKFDPEDPVIKEYIEKALANSKIVPESVKIRGFAERE